MRYWVSFKIEGRYVAAVEANNVNEAIEKAKDEYIDANFGELQDIDGEPIIIQDENDNFVWEK